MKKTLSVLRAIAVALTVSNVALAQDTELGRLREEMKQLQRTYQEGMRALEERLAQAEAKALKAEQSAQRLEETVRTQSPATGGSERASRSIFNPAISLILQGTYSRSSQDPNNFAITGFLPSGGEVGPPRRNFGLGETELNFSASIDPYFRGVAIAALTPENEVEVEEAYFQTLGLPVGLTAKAGRFLSGIGYQNEIHQHAWDFQDAPLPYKAFLAGRYTQDGAQLRWIAPTAIFLEIGAEIGNGAFFPGSDRSKNGAGSAAAFARIGGDIGASYSWRSGLSYLRTSARGRSYDDLDAMGNSVSNSFDGSSRLWALDAVLKWAPNGNAVRNNLKLQAEYFAMRERGSLTFDEAGAVLTDYFRSHQSGWYGQSIWQFMPRWRVGYRYDALRRSNLDLGVVNNGLGPTAADFPILAAHRPTRHTAMVDLSPSEFSRLRLQFAADKSRRGVTDNQVILQYIHSLGAHGAHRF